MVNSNRKGKVGEREWAQWLCDNLGLKARRGQQRSGVDTADVIDGIPGTHAEVKRVEALNLQQAMAQVWRDAPDGSVPYVAHRRNGCPWMVTVHASDLVKFARLVTEVPDA